MVALGANIICNKIPGLAPKQRLICRSRPNAIVAIGDGAKLGASECRFQFKNMRWNCSSIDSDASMFGYERLGGQYCGFDVVVVVVFVAVIVVVVVFVVAFVYFIDVEILMPLFWDMRGSKVCTVFFMMLLLLLLSRLAEDRFAWHSVPHNVSIMFPLRLPSDGIDLA